MPILRNIDIKGVFMIVTNYKNNIVEKGGSIE